MADITITAANVVFTSGQKANGTAGGTITAGQAIYKDAADSKLKAAQANGAAGIVDAVGIALHASLNNQPLAYAADGAVINIGGTTSKATTYCVSAAAAGGVAPQADLTSGHRIVQLGYATDAVGAFVVQIRNRNSVV